MEYKNKINKEKKIKSENKIKKINLEFENRYRQWEEKLLKSNIDFSKNGWKTKCLELLKTSPGKFKRFLNKTNFINNHNCYINSNMIGSFGQKWVIDKNNKRKRIKI